ncbi:sigma-70 family RNA polymerase sigma factor [Nocardia amamiensis]|uniref:Sigma-70 family RNA polymerase sigma factor n=1 Tax=Nocardia amamiensis TaxID=404578 RepID=A0ABS0CY61_9NOCA|nr:sigma-70 family RNA polymerase sigma factor [Nocardia amamiensis]MBF6301085.1 sigma-70 family RNA polymerase sigma factor [Nocardia amamiensis]
MDDRNLLAEQFERNRSHLRSVAYRMLGSISEADDAVQQAWLRLDRAATDDVDNLTGWLTTVVGRVCLDMLRARRARREESVGLRTPEPIRAGPGVAADPEDEAIVADSVGLALLTVIETLTPAERVTFVLHDLFDVPLAEIAPILGRSVNAAAQLASRARRRVRGADPVLDADQVRQKRIVEAFLAAARRGDFEDLLAVLDPEVVLHADAAAAPARHPLQVRGATAVARGARAYADRARFAWTALIDGRVGILNIAPGRAVLALDITVTGTRITAIDIIAESEHLSALDIVLLRSEPSTDAAAHAGTWL